MAGIITKELVVDALRTFGPIAPKDLVKRFRPYLSDASNAHKVSNRDLFRTIIDEVSEVCEDKSLRLKPSLETPERPAVSKLPPSAEPIPEPAAPPAPKSPKVQRTKPAETVAPSVAPVPKAAAPEPALARAPDPIAPPSPAAPAAQEEHEARVLEIKRSNSVEQQTAAEHGEISWPVIQGEIKMPQRSPVLGKKGLDGRKASDPIMALHSDYMSRMARMKGASDMSLLSNASTDFSDEDYIHYHDNKSFRLGRIRHFKDQDHDHNMTVVRRASTVRTSTAQKRWLRSAMGEDVLEIKRLIREDPTLVNHRDIFSGFSALHWAAKTGNTDLIDVLNTSNDLNVDICAHNGQTPLHVAYHFEQLQAIAKLKTIGAQSTCDNAGRQPEDLGSRRRSALPIADLDSFDVTASAQASRYAYSGPRSRANTAPTQSATKPRRSSNRMFKLFSKSKDTTSEDKEPAMTLPTISSDNVDSPGPRAPLTSGVFFSPGPNDEGFHFKEEGTYLAGADLNASHLSTHSAKSPIMKRIKESFRGSRRKNVSSPLPMSDGRSRSLEDLQDTKQSHPKRKQSSAQELKVRGMPVKGYDA